MKRSRRKNAAPAGGAKHKNGARTLTLPPHANAKPHGLVMQRLRTMTADEFMATLVKSGIYTSKGKLTARYASPSKAKTKQRRTAAST